MKKLLIASLALLLAGCSASAIDQNVLPDVQNKTLALVIHDPPGFMAMTADKSMFAKPEVDKAFADGDKLVQEFDIYDPARNICRMMAELIGDNRGLMHNKDSMIKTKSKKVKDLVRLANHKDYLLDVETVYWHFINKEFKVPDYYIRYVVKMRFIDVENASSIGQSTCDYDTLSAGEPLVSYETLVENDADYIKRTLDKASNYCVEKFSKEFL